MRGIITSRMTRLDVLGEGLLDGLEAVAGGHHLEAGAGSSIFSIIRSTSGLSSAMRTLGRSGRSSGALVVAGGRILTCGGHPSRSTTR